MTQADELKRCRDAFEAWYAKPGCPSLKRSGHDYKLMQTHNSWTSWEAAWNTRPQPDTAAQPVSNPDELRETAVKFLKSIRATDDGWNATDKDVDALENAIRKAKP